MIDRDMIHKVGKPIFDGWGYAVTVGVDHDAVTVRIGSGTEATLTLTDLVALRYLLGLAAAEARANEAKLPPEDRRRLDTAAPVTPQDRERVDG